MTAQHPTPTQSTQQQQKQPVTAWESLPGLVRFAVWVWAIVTVVCLGLGWLVAVVVLGLR